MQPVSTVHDLEVYIDADVTMRTHVTNTVGACFLSLRQLRSVQRSLLRHTLLTLVRALDVSKVDDCISVLAGISGSLQNRLQSILNQPITSFATSAHRIMTGVKRLDKVRNTTVLTSVSRNELIHTVYDRQLRFLGHMLRNTLST